MLLYTDLHKVHGKNTRVDKRVESFVASKRGVAKLLEWLCAILIFEQLEFENSTIRKFDLVALKYPKFAQFIFHCLNATNKMKFNALLNFLHRFFVIVNNKLYIVRRTMKNATFAFSPRRKVLQPCFNSRLPRLLSRLIRAFRARIRIHIAARSLYLHLRRDLHFDYCFKRAGWRAYREGLRRHPPPQPTPPPSARVSRGLLSE
jgi:hypothetical protein